MLWLVLQRSSSTIGDLAAAHEAEFEVSHG